MAIRNNTLIDLTQQALEIAHAAGKRISEVYKQQYKVEYKSDNTPVTTADLDANFIIESELQKLAIDLPVLSEESHPVPYSERHHWTRYWLVDPLDGTREFIRGNGEFSVNIALIENGKPIIGVVTAPELNISYFASKGHGAWKQIGGAEPQSIHVRPAPVEKGGLTIARSRCPTVGPRLQAFLDKVGDHTDLPMGSSLKSCLVAEGAADLYVRLGPTSEWDTAAAQCIVEEAGGRITNIKLQGLQYNTSESLLNPYFMVFGDETHNWTAYLPANLPAS
jgi:3'(2'), 5'-bisphosphate nucleotidase